MHLQFGEIERGSKATRLWNELLTLLHEVHKKATSVC